LHPPPYPNREQITSVPQTQNEKEKKIESESIPKPNETIWTNGTYAIIAKSHIKNARALRTMHTRVDRYPEPSKITRYRNLPKYRNCIEEFIKYDNNSIAQMINDTPKTYLTIMGANINAAIEKSSTEDSKNSNFALIGPHGNKNRNKRGDMVRNLMYLHNRKSTSTFFDNKDRINMLICPAMRKQYKVDHIFISSKHI